MTDDEGAEAKEGPRSRFYLPNCRTLRLAAGWGFNDLAAEAKVDRATIAKKIEKQHPVTEVIAHRVFNALNKRHGQRLKIEREIITSLRKKR